MTTLTPFGRIKTLRGLLAGLAIVTTPVAANADEFINILTGGTSGVYYPIGVGLAKIYADGIPGARTQVQATKASVENLNLLQQGKGEFAIALGDAVKLAWDGNADAGFAAPLDKLRGISAAYPNYIQIAASADSGVVTLADLAGHSLSVGAAKSGTELNARAILGAAGMSYEGLSKIEYLPFAESVELMKNRQLDASLQSAGLGVASLKDLATSTPTTIVAIPPEVVAALGAPYLSAVIPAGTYEGQAADVPTAAVGNFFVTHEGVSDETAYLMTKLLFENLPALQASHNAAASIKLETALDGMPIPLHPGAERYYREIGLIKD
ncbi:MAG: TAXI family TRAP transporter solute-binding subunit [Cypionkella sp.]|uniref:TAXI family TRAP transporter solute-binding subunit n=1 Tax=Cypionkella sp. TaxID=2811411 RepID=UPI002ABD0F61|nr:TAXI family TRAP transporter solute-binding subunit [Cypionkella sp.]MDZ4309500.1 TAXI family TRAP transporter solute-binding subunit [Cypionkella sp.]MDZ4392887.1 TAXI family TRAP transporter solute-binding subunit [Cypionkella sp.]